MDDIELHRHPSIAGKSSTDTSLNAGSKRPAAVIDESAKEKKVSNAQTSNRPVLNGPKKHKVTHLNSDDLFESISLKT